MKAGRLFAPLGIGRKLTLGFGALAAVTLLVVALAFVAGRSATHDIMITEGVRGPAALASAQAQASLLRMQLHVRGYLVLSDPQDIEQYHSARQAFEQSLASLQSMSRHWSEEDVAQWVEALTANYARWVELPQHLFELHDNPLRNRPALRLARGEVQALRVQILDDLDVMIGVQEKRRASPQSRELLADLLGFQASFDTMVTNLMAYAVSGELNFKLAYVPQLAINAAIWDALSGKRDLLSTEQQVRLDAIARQRAEVGELALRIVRILNGDHAYEDLYLYRTQFVPQAEALLGLLGKVTARQQMQLQTDLARARGSLADARLQTVAGGLVAVIFSITMAFLFRRNIVGPVRRLTGVAEQVTAGDLAARAAVESRDEIGVLATSINIMTQRLAQTIEHLKAVFMDAERAKDTAETANRAKSRFLANMSHELRTPLNGILGYAQILRRDTTLNERQLAGVNVIQQSGEHLLTLINDILDFAKIEAGKQELHLSDIQTVRFLRLITEMVSLKTAQKGLIFRCDMAPDVPGRVLADEKRLRQVLLNLLSNAVRFTDRGEVSLHLHCQSPGRLCFEVQDTGSGISAEQLETIFEPFEQVGEARHRLGGTGLGLAISRQCVRLMGGEIQVESRVGQGSRFWFELDVQVLDAAAAAAMSSDRFETGYEGKRRQVLVVDDMAENRAVLIEMLERLGFETSEAGNGGEALEQAQRLRPDLILMDVVMPEMDGLEATRRMRRLPGLENLPIIAISASASGGDEKDSLTAGASAFLPKPIDLGLLLTCIGTLLHLNWIYALPPAGPMEPEANGLLVAPPAHEMAILHHLARIGSMSDIVQRAGYLAGLDERYIPFAGRLRQLAGGYHSKALLGMVEHYMEGNPPA